MDDRAESDRGLTPMEQITNPHDKLFRETCLFRITIDKHAGYIYLLFEHKRFHFLTYILQPTPCPSPEGPGLLSFCKNVSLRGSHLAGIRNCFAAEVPRNDRAAGLLRSACGIPLPAMNEKWNSRL